MPVKAATCLPANVATDLGPLTVARAKRARRAKLAAPLTPPVVVIAAHIAVDLASPNARKILMAAFPRPLTDTMVIATEEQELFAASYIAARERAKVEADRQALAGVGLIDGIRGDIGMTGIGWKATLALRRGDIDTARMFKELGIDTATAERFRKPSYRVLDVRETATEGDGAT